MPHAEHRTSHPEARGRLFRPHPLDRPFYPVPMMGDYVVKPREVVKIAGQPFVRTPDGEWLLVDRADVAVTETDD